MTPTEAIANELYREWHSLNQAPSDAQQILAALDAAGYRVIPKPSDEVRAEVEALSRKRTEADNVIQLGRIQPEPFRTYLLDVAHDLDEAQRLLRLAAAYLGSDVGEERLMDPQELAQRLRECAAVAIEEATAGDPWAIAYAEDDAGLLREAARLIDGYAQLQAERDALRAAIGAHKQTSGRSMTRNPRDVALWAVLNEGSNG